MARGCSGTKLVSFNKADSFNDAAMLTEAHVGFLFRAPDNVKAKFPQFNAVESYAELMKSVKGAMG